MIITKIIGGLGNQLFQYTAGRCLAHLNNTDLKLDVTAFDEYKLRNFDLFNLNVSAQFANDQEILNLMPSTKVARAWQRLLPVKKRHYYRQPFFHFDPKFYKAGANTYIKGYWQSEKYFLPIRDTIIKELTFKPGVIDNVMGFVKELQQAQSVAVHIRRGDYTNSVATEMHGILPVEYYQKAMTYIRKQHEDAKFYFFSDDMLWVKDNLNIENMEFVSGKISKSHYEDFFLMSKCHHNVIANSSFGWWAAWLNNNPDKIVVAPKNWFNKGPKDTQDLLPSSWIKI